VLLIDAVTTGNPEIIDLSIVGLISGGRDAGVSYETGDGLLTV
jgi:hypothetical protein